MWTQETRDERNARIQARVNATKFTDPRTYTDGDYRAVISQDRPGHVNNDIVHVTFYDKTGAVVERRIYDSSAWSADIIEYTKEGLRQWNKEGS
ncbi:MAG: hypothetical protein ACXWQ5_01005 [Ktedonobacterales bacterium]